ncbi:MAG TPA: threonine ammonia-lyase [Gemmatimonadaceae bacterium]|nr:threonine ammonia-lyase [Gemmatimonadaceae bacterium]
MLKLADIQDARERIASGIVHTPIVPALSLRADLPSDAYLKLENTQRTGSFKDRGALNRLLLLSADERRRGVVTASAGNHAQAVAYHGGQLGIRVTVVMPVHTPLIKVANTEQHGATIVLHGETLAEAMVEAHRREEAQGWVFVHAFDDDQVIAGQGTIGLELLEQLPGLTAVVVPIGGGGLIAGIAMAIKEQRPDVRVYGVEAAAAASALASRRAGYVVARVTSETIADGIAVKRVGARTFPLLERYVDDIVTVSEEQIAGAVHALLERQKVLAEGAGAVALAAVAAGLVPVGVQDTTAMVLSGGNIDLNLLERIVDRGRVATGRLVRLAITAPDRPGELARMTQLVAEGGANVLGVTHHRAFADVSVREVDIIMDLETRGRDQVARIEELLTSHGFRVREGE